MFNRDDGSQRGVTGASYTLLMQNEGVKLLQTVIKRRSDKREGRGEQEKDEQSTANGKGKEEGG